MIETSVAGTPFEVRDLDEEWLLDAAREAEVQARMAERRKVRLAAQWCVLHEIPAGSENAATWADDPGGMGCPEPLGGPGTPQLAAFSPEPFASALGISSLSGMALLADVLDLVHRLPLIHARVEELAVPVWKARKVATWTHQLSAAAAAFVDAELAPVLERRGLVTIERVVAAAIARFHPELLAERERRGRAGWDVRVIHPSPTMAEGTSTLDAQADSVDLDRFAGVVGEIARLLGRAGDTDTLGQRKAKTLGLLADLHAGADLDELIATVAAHSAAAADDPAAPPAGSRVGVRPRRAILHLSPDDLAGGVVGVEEYGPATLATVRAWLADARVTVQPVLDLAEVTWAVDEHDPPAAMADLVRLRDPHCVFPWCDRDARACDLDHVTAYQEHGPLGQTTPANLAPLCRRHHRCKTSGRWRYRRNPDHSYTWTGPHGHRYHVTQKGTQRLDP